ncbi:exported chitinase [Ktedonobacteria bacterium brp13]|nr:exported chitinase [Ktedonobacteria bacterium brp13]
MRQSKYWYAIGGCLVVLAGAASLIFALYAKSPAHAAQNPTGVFAPYVDTSLYSTQITSLASVEQQTGVKNYTLAFMLNGGGTCNAEWNGDISLNQPDDPTQKSISVNINSNIQDLRSSGGNVIISFGGANGTELAQSCTDVNSLEQQYQAVISKYQVTQLDFDVENNAVTDQASIDRRNQALAALQAQNKNLLIDYTLPVLPTGLTQDGLNVIQSAIKYNVNINIVNGMAMDYGTGIDTNPSPGNMGNMAEQVGQSLHDRLQPLYSSKSSAQIWSMVGITPMIGQNDNQQEIFTPQDAAALEGWAAQQGVGLLSLWSMARDVACPGGATGSASPTCSSVAQQPFDYSKTFNQFASGSIAPAPTSTSTSAPTPTPTPAPTTTPTSTPTTTPTTTPTSTPPVQGTPQGGIQAWKADNSNPPLYNPGDEVTYNGNTYKCLRQIWGETQWAPDAPGIASNFWQQVNG